ncbi:MAG TPA: hypothetical protein VK889_06815 [Solirubrobacterales bacterium]|nr:hypothetical protein [Solirubrobacterales bacterium]
MKRTLLLLGVVATLAVTAIGANGASLHLQVGELFVDTSATISPSRLPARGGAPVEVTSVVKVSTRDGSTPTALEKLVLQFDKHGAIDPRGWPRCTAAKLSGKTTARARAVCRKAIVGEGTAKAVVTPPGQAPFRISSPLVFFNAPPTGGKPTMLVHAYEKFPEPKALLTPIVIAKVSAGRYGYRAEIEMPEIAAGYGAATLSEATVGATRKRGGRTVGFLNAYCQGSRLQVYGTVHFTDGGFTNGTLVQACRVAD